MQREQVEPQDPQDLVARARTGDREAFGELVAIHQHEVYTLAVRLVRDRDMAADVAQDAFIRAWRAMPKFRGDAKFSTWLHRITVNTAWTHRSKKNRVRLDPLDSLKSDPESTSLDPARAGEAASARPEIEAALQRCSELIEQTGARLYTPQLHEQRSALADLAGERAGRERELREAYRLYAEMGATGHAERVARELAS